MSTTLFIYIIGLSVSIALIGTLLTVFFDVPSEGEEVIPWSELDAEGMSEKEIDEKIRAGFVRKKLYGLDRYKYIFAFPSVYGRTFLEIFLPSFTSAFSMVYILKYVG